MRIRIQYLLLFASFFLLVFSCKKDDTTPTTTTITPTVGGATSSYKDTVSVTAGNVIIKYSRTNQCYPSNEIFTFTATGTGFPSSATYEWTFGDSHTATGTTVRNIYNATGNYTVILSIKDNNQVLNKTSVSISAWGQQVTPHAAFAVQIFDVNFLNNMSFTSSSSVQRGTLTNYLWDWADGTPQTSTANAFTPHNFPPVAADKSYPVQLVVTANSGCKDTAVVAVSVPAVYSLSGNFDAVATNVCINETFTMTPKVTGAPAGAIYKWDFADATGLAEGNPVTHIFTYQNDYDVKMYVYLSGKLIYQTHKAVRANGQNIRPKALMLKNVVTSDASSVTWAFYSQSNIPHGYYIGYRWEFSNGRVDDNFNTYVENLYTKGTSAATETVKLIVTGNSGCKDTATAVITIPAK